MGWRHGNNPDKKRGKKEHVPMFPFPKGPKMSLFPCSPMFPPKNGSLFPMFLSNFSNSKCEPLLKTIAASGTQLILMLNHLIHFSNHKNRISQTIARSKTFSGGKCGLNFFFPLHHGLTLWKCVRVNVPPPSVLPQSAKNIHPGNPFFACFSPQLTALFL